MCYPHKVAVLKSRYNFSDAIIDNMRLIVQILYAHKMFYIKGALPLLWLLNPDTMCEPNDLPTWDKLRHLHLLVVQNIHGNHLRNLDLEKRKTIWMHYVSMQVLTVHRGPHQFVDISFVIIAKGKEPEYHITSSSANT